MYPDYPKNRLIVNGIDLSEEFKMILIDGYTLEPPEPKVYTVDIPGGNGTIDLTEAVSGDTAFNNRKQEFEFYIVDISDFEKIKTKISNFLHGKSFYYKLTMDPDYMYHGRFTISSYEHKMYTVGKVGIIKITIDADPYKNLPDVRRKVNAVGGIYIPLDCGRKSVKPYITIGSSTIIEFEGKRYTFEYSSDRADYIGENQTDTYRMNDVVLKQGTNYIYVNSYPIHALKWSDLGKEVTFKEFSKKRLFEWYKSKPYSVYGVPETILEYEWADI